MLEHVAGLVVELGDRGVQGDRHLLAGGVAGSLDPLQQQLKRLGVGLEVGGETALVAHGGAMSLVVEGLLQVVKDLGAHSQRLGEALSADRNDHELLEVDGVVGVGATVEHVHHRHREDVCGLAAEIPPQRLPLLGRRRVCGGQRHREHRVGAQPGLVGRAVEGDQRPVERRLSGRIETANRRRDLAVDILHRLGDALAQPRRAAVAQFGGLELAGRRARGHCRPTPRPGGDRQLHLDRRVAATVEDLTGVDVLDLAHGAPRS